MPSQAAPPRLTCGTCRYWAQIGEGLARAAEKGFGSGQSDCRRYPQWVKKGADYDACGEYFAREAAPQ